MAGRSSSGVSPQLDDLLAANVRNFLLSSEKKPSNQSGGLLGAHPSPGYHSNSSGYRTPTMQARRPVGTPYYTPPDTVNAKRGSEAANRYYSQVIPRGNANMALTNALEGDLQDMMSNMFTRRAEVETPPDLTAGSLHRTPENDTPEWGDYVASPPDQFPESETKRQLACKEEEVEKANQIAAILKDRVKELENTTGDLRRQLSSLESVIEAMEQSESTLSATNDAQAQEIETVQRVHCVLQADLAEKQKQLEEQQELLERLAQDGQARAREMERERLARSALEEVVESMQSRQAERASHLRHIVSGQLRKQLGKLAQEKREVRQMVEHAQAVLTEEVHAFSAQLSGQLAAISRLQSPSKIVEEGQAAVATEKDALILQLETQLEETQTELRSLKMDLIDLEWMRGASDANDPPSAVLETSPKTSGIATEGLKHKMEHLLEELAHSEKSREVLEEQCTKMEEERQSWQIRIQKLTGELLTRRQGQEEASRELEDVQRQLAEKEAMEVRLRGQLQESRAARRSAEQEEGERSALVANWERELASKNRENDKLKRELETVHAAMSSMKEQEGNTTRELDELREGRLSGLSQSQAYLSQIGRLDEALASAQNEKAHLADDLQDAIVQRDELIQLVTGNNINFAQMAMDEVGRLKAENEALQRQLKLKGGNEALVHSPDETRQGQLTSD
jgi:FtsZ-binding cell division protein ZapB